MILLLEVDRLSVVRVVREGRQVTIPKRYPKHGGKKLSWESLVRMADEHLHDHYLARGYDDTARTDPFHKNVAYTWTRRVGRWHLVCTTQRLPDERLRVVLLEALAVEFKRRCPAPLYELAYLVDHAGVQDGTFVYEGDSYYLATAAEKVHDNAVAIANAHETLRYHKMRIAELEGVDLVEYKVTEDWK